MVDPHIVDKQLKKLGFDGKGWNRAEVKELPNILVEDEEIYELVNGYYEGGFALLVASNIRVLLIDKKPLNFLTVEDLRFDMINEIDYSHRLMGAQITMSSGSKTLKFRSYNQPRLRKLITHVQHCMAQNKIKQSEHQEDQKSHLEQINHQLQAYLIAQHQQQMQMQQQLQQGQSPAPASIPEPIKPSPELADFLYAQGLLAQHRQPEDKDKAQQESVSAPPEPEPAAVTTETKASAPTPEKAEVATQRSSLLGDANNAQLADLYVAGRDEIFGKQDHQSKPAPTPQSSSSASQMPTPIPQDASTVTRPPLDVNPLRIAYSRLPMALRNRRFGRPSFHAHSQAPTTTVASSSTP